jgi:hypothetical protein
MVRVTSIGANAIGVYAVPWYVRRAVGISRHDHVDNISESWVVLAHFRTARVERLACHPDHSR